MSISCQKGLYEVASLQGLATPLNPTFEQFEQENWKIGFVGHPLSILNIIYRGGPTFFYQSGRTEVCELSRVCRYRGSHYDIEEEISEIIDR